MLTPLIYAFLQLTDPTVRKVVWISSLGSVTGFAALVFGVPVLMHALHLSGIAWLDWGLDVLGGIGIFIIAFLLFPAVMAAVSGLFLDEVAIAVERRHFPNRVSSVSQPLGEMALSALRLLLVAILLNLLVLPLYLIPGANLLLFLALNGYLLGRQYFEQVAGRHLGLEALTALRRRLRLKLWGAGAVICGLATLPLVNLLAPVIATAFMVHIFHRSQDSGLAAASRP